jgi:hypothetical protein
MNESSEVETARGGHSEPISILLLAGGLVLFGVVGIVLPLVPLVIASSIM